MSTQRCTLDPSTHFGMVIVFILASLDLGLTITGITMEKGVEGNPFYAPFAEAGTLYMLAGVALYAAILIYFFHRSPQWLQAAGVGLLVAAHVWGALSWVRVIFIQFEIQMFWLLITTSLMASMGAILTYVDIRTCPGIRSVL